MHFLRYRKWPNVLCETAIFDKKRRKCAPRRNPFWTPKWAPKWARDRPKNGPIFGPSFGPILGSLWGPFWEPSGPQDGPGRGQEEPKRTKRGSERPKGRLSKKWISRETVCIFSLLRPPKTTPRGQKDCQGASRGG